MSVVYSIRAHVLTNIVAVLMMSANASADQVLPSSRTPIATGLVKVHFSVFWIRMEPLSSYQNSSIAGAGWKECYGSAKKHLIE